jgi:hypothetical protein
MVSKYITNNNILINNMKNKLIKYIDLIHVSSLEYYIRKLSENEISLIWLSDDYDHRFPAKLHNIDGDYSLYDEEREIFCYCLISKKDKTWLYQEQFDHFENPEKYKERQIDPMVAMQSNYVLFNPSSRIEIDTSEVIICLKKRLKNLDPKIEQRPPRDLLGQFNVLPEYLEY